MLLVGCRCLWRVVCCLCLLFVRCVLCFCLWFEVVRWPLVGLCVCLFVVCCFVLVVYCCMLVDCFVFCVRCIYFLFIVGLI